MHAICVCGGSDPREGGVLENWILHLIGSGHKGQAVANYRRLDFGMKVIEKTHG